MDVEFLDSFLFYVVCCNGLMDLFNEFLKYCILEFLNEKLKYFYFIYIVLVFYNYKILCELIWLEVDVNLQIYDDGLSFLVLVVGNDIMEYVEFKEDDLSENMCEKIIDVLLENKGDINLCRKDGVSFFYVVC